MRVMSTSKSGSTSLKLSIGASDCPAGEELYEAPLLAEQLERLIERARPFVVELRRLHDGSDAGARSQARLTAASRRGGVIGDSLTSTPSECRASLIALASAAGGAMAPPSPIPLTPNSV